MTPGLESLYNEVAYPGHPFAQTHPGHLSAIATLFGVPFASVPTCRVLELGCGDGGNLIPMALTLPQATFTGIDLAEAPVSRGRSLIETLNLTNIKLHAEDLLAFDDSRGQFDYIISHGLYSWTPPAVRDRILRISSEQLSPNGIAYVSYNALPGAALRKTLREMMLFHVGDIEDTSERIAQARALLGFIASARLQPDVFSRHVAEEASRMFERESWAFFHDELGDIYEPFYFHQFMEQAERHGLQYLAESHLSDMQEGRLTSEAIATLDAVAEVTHNDDRIAREQYADFAHGRAFRQTLLCHADRTVHFPPVPERLEALYVSTTARRVGNNEYRAANGSGMNTEHPQARALLDMLIEADPQALPVSQLAAPREIILGTALSGVTQLHTEPFVLTTYPGTKPNASPLARWQAEQGLPLTTLHHATLHLEDPIDLELLQRLDGTRSRHSLAQIADLDARIKTLAKSGLLLS